MPKPVEFLYRSVSSIEVPGFVVDKIGEDQVTAAQTPFKKGFIQDFSRIVVSRRKSKSVPEFIQISPAHGRSFEMRYGAEGFIFWADEYGNMYGTQRLKGGNVMDPDVKIEKRAPSGFLIWGIQDSDSILRTVKALNLMRADNIDTEAIVHLAEPAQLSFRGELVSIEEYKKRLVWRVWKDNHRDLKERRDSDAWKPATRKDIPALSKALEEMTFYLTTSAQQVSERFLDLKHISSQDDLKKIMKRVFTFVNARNKWWERTGIGEQEEALDGENPADIMRYFVTILPDRLASNYGKLHKIGEDEYPNEYGLLHIYPHLGNVSLVGSIYDVDSAVGKPLGIGDAAVTEEEKLEEIDFLLSGKPGFVHADGIINLLKTLEKQNVLPKSTSRAFAKVFVISYMEQRGWINNVTTSIKYIERLLNIADIDLESEDDAIIRDHLLTTMGQKNFDYLMRRRAFQGYSYPLVIDLENTTPPEVAQSQTDTAEITDLSKERKLEIIELSKQLMNLHQAHISQFPATGENYFSFPLVSQDILDAHNQIKKADIIDIIRLWVGGDLKKVVGEEYTPRSIGSFLLTLAQINAPDTAEAIRSATPSKDDPDLITKLSHLHAFFQLVPPRFLKTWFDRYIYELVNDRHLSFNLTKEAGKRSAIALFGYGLITRDLHEIFNHQLVDIILNEFTNQQSQALQAALSCPDQVDSLGGQENVISLLKTGLTGVWVRDGITEEGVQIPEEGEVNQSISANMQYFFASNDRDQITDGNVRQVLEVNISKGWVANVVRHLLRAKKVLHPNSFFAQSLSKADLEANDVVEILKMALDVNDGDITRLDPTIKSSLEGKNYKGEITKDEASKLTLACIGFGVDLPDMLDPYLAHAENRRAFLEFLYDSKKLRSREVRRDMGVYRALESYPVNPTYAFISKGVEALPAKLRMIFEEYGENRNVINELTLGIMEHLFSEDYSSDGYFRNFFGGMLHVDGYPLTEFRFNDYGQVRSMGKIGWQLWRIVHPDIWKIVTLADTKLLVNFIKTELPENTVVMGSTNWETGIIGRRKSPLSDCLPPHLYERVTSVVDN